MFKDYLIELLFCASVKHSVIQTENYLSIATYQHSHLFWNLKESQIFEYFVGFLVYYYYYYTTVITNTSSLQKQPLNSRTKVTASARAGISTKKVPK